MRFVIELDVPDSWMYDATKRDVRMYIKDAVIYWSKGGDPGNPFFDLREKHVKVKSVKEAAT